MLFMYRVSFLSKWQNFFKGVYDLKSVSSKVSADSYIYPDEVCDLVSLGKHWLKVQLEGQMRDFQITYYYILSYLEFNISLPLFCFFYENIHWIRMKCLRK